MLIFFTIQVEIYLVFAPKKKIFLETESNTQLFPDHFSSDLTFSVCLLVYEWVQKSLLSLHLENGLVDRLKIEYEPVHEISNNVVCATSKASDQPAHTRSLIRAFASRLNIL